MKDRTKARSDGNRNTEREGREGGGRDMRGEVHEGRKKPGRQGEEGEERREGGEHLTSIGFPVMKITTAQHTTTHCTHTAPRWCFEQACKRASMHACMRYRYLAAEVAALDLHADPANRGPCGILLRIDRLAVAHVVRLAYVGRLILRLLGREVGDLPTH
jgi:hypothetical protein